MYMVNLSDENWLVQNEFGLAQFPPVVTHSLINLANAAKLHSNTTLSDEPKYRNGSSLLQL